LPVVVGAVSNHDEETSGNEKDRQNTYKIQDKDHFTVSVDEKGIVPAGSKSKDARIQRPEVRT